MEGQRATVPARHSDASQRSFRRQRNYQRHHRDQDRRNVDDRHLADELPGSRATGSGGGAHPPRSRSSVQEGAKRLIGRYVPSAGMGWSKSLSIAGVRSRRRQRRTERPNGVSTWRAMSRPSFLSGSKTALCRRRGRRSERRRHDASVRGLGTCARMLFNSFIFVFAFLPLSLLLTYGAESGIRPPPRSLYFACRWPFYAWWRPSQLPLLLISIAFNDIVGEWMQRARAADRPRQVQAVLVAGVLADVHVPRLVQICEFRRRQRKFGCRFTSSLTELRFHWRYPSSPFRRLLI